MNDSLGLYNSISNGGEYEVKIAILIAVTLIILLIVTGVISLKKKFPFFSCKWER